MNARARGLTLIESLVLLVILAVVLSVLLPALGQVGLSALSTSSWHNLRVLDSALECYAADWEDRQFTAVPDDLGVVGGSCAAYANEFGCYPPLLMGWDCDGALWAYWQRCPEIGGSTCGGNVIVTRPIHFDTEYPVGFFRLPHVQAIHDYVGGKVYDPTYYSPLDLKAYEAAEPLFGVDCEFVPNGGLIVPSSYVLSPAAMYHPDVFRAPSQGGFQHPDTLDFGYESPAVGQVRYAHLKTRMIEHHWLRDPPAECNAAYEDPFGGYADGCDPFLFNHGADAEPLALFFDGSVRTLRTGDVFEDDLEILKRTGVDGLWSRDTPLGSSGYFGDISHDGTIVSHHILTTGGILGRDTLP